jgi:transcription antitermination factor NusG
MHQTVPCSRWHCAWTHPNQETRAEWSLMELGFRAFLPLHIERGPGPNAHQQVAPLFRGYLFVCWNPATDQWRRIYRARGIAGIIGSSTAHPAPFAEGVIEELLARTSGRRIVDDDLDPAPPAIAAPRQHWQDITQLSAKARGELLLRLFGGEAVAA